MAGLAGGSFFTSTGALLAPSSPAAEASLGLVSWSSRCKILWRSVRVLWEAGHWGAELALGGRGDEALVASAAPAPLLSSDGWLVLALAVAESSSVGGFDPLCAAGEDKKKEPVEPPLLPPPSPPPPPTGE